MWCQRGSGSSWRTASTTTPAGFFLPFSIWRPPPVVAKIATVWAVESLPPFPEGVAPSLAVVYDVVRVNQSSDNSGPM
eukprot:11195090-Lingulodinium_polyedra.AAC.1